MSTNHGKSNGFRIVTAEVTNIEDPDKNGRAQLRIFGMQDDKTNIPDKDLHWGTPMLGSDNPAVQKTGTSGNGLLKGSQVMVAFWDNGQGQQSPIILGSFAKAGEQKEGSSSDGSDDIDTKKSDTPTAAKGEGDKNDKNTVVTNPIKDANTTPGTTSDDDEGKNIYNDITKKDATHKDKPSVGTANNAANGNLLEMIKKFDPKNASGSIKNAVDSMMKLKNMEQLSSQDGQDQSAGAGLGKALNMLGSTIGQANMLKMLQNILKPQPSNTNPTTNQYQFSDDEREIKILQYAIIELCDSIKGKDEPVVIKLEDQNSINQSDIDDVIEELAIYAHDELNYNVQNNTATKQMLIQLIKDIMAKSKSASEKKATGGANAGNILSQLAKMLPQLAGQLTNTLTDHLPKSVLDQDKINESLQKFSMNQTTVKKKEDYAKEAFEGGENGESEESTKIQDATPPAVLYDPATGKETGVA